MNKWEPEVRIGRRVVSAVTAAVMFLSLMIADLPFVKMTAEAAPAEQYGELVIDDDSFQMVMGEEEMYDNRTVKDGDDILMAFEWSVENNAATPTFDDIIGQNVYKYRKEINTYGIKFGTDSGDGTYTMPSGELYENGEVIGHYKFVEEDGKFYAVVELYESAFKERSDVGGGIRLEGVVDLDENKDVPNGSEKGIGFGTAEFTVIYDDGKKNCDMSVSKSGGSGLVKAEDGSYYVDYTVRVTATGLIDQFELDDVIDPALTIDGGSIRVDGQPVTETEFPITIKTTNKTKEDKQSFTVTYRAKMTAEDYTANRNKNLSNKATATYDDGSPDPAVKTSTSTVTPKDPSISKSVTGKDGTQGDNLTLYDAKNQIKWVHGGSRLSGECLYPVIDYSIDIDLGTGENISDDELKEIVKSIKDNFNDWGSSVGYMTKEDWVPYDQYYASLRGDYPSFLATYLYNYDGDLSRITDSEWEYILHYCIDKKGNGKYTLNYSVILTDETLRTEGNAHTSGYGSFTRNPVQNTVQMTVDDVPLTDAANVWLDLGINLLDKDIELDAPRDITSSDKDWTNSSGAAGRDYETGRLKTGKELTDVDLPYGKGTDGILEIPHRIRINGKDFKKWFDATGGSSSSDKFILTDSLQMMISSRNPGGNDSQYTTRPYNDHHYFDANDFWAGFHIYAVNPNSNSYTEVSITNPASTSPQATASAMIVEGGLTEIDSNGQYRGFQLELRKQQWNGSYYYTDYYSGETYPMDMVITYYSKVKMVKDASGNYVLDPEILANGGYNFLNTAFVQTEIDGKTKFFDSGFTLEYPNTPATDTFSNISKYAVDSLTVGGEKFEMTSAADGKVGWGISIPLNGVKDGDEFSITDTLPDGLTFDEDSLKTIYTSSSPSKNMTVSGTVADITVSGIGVTASGSDVIFTLTVTQDMIDKASGLGAKYISIIFSTSYDKSKLIQENSTEKSVSFKNTATAVYNDKKLSSRNASQSVDVPQVASKSVLVDEEHAKTYNEIIAAYTLDINIGGNDLITGQDRLTVTDTMPASFRFHEDTLKVVDADGNDFTDYTYTLEDNVLTFDLPDSKQLQIKYEVQVDVDVIGDPLWYIGEKTTNKFEITGMDLKSTENRVDLTSFSGMIKAWVYSTNGNITISKYTIDQLTGGKKPLPGAKFDLYSVYDNMGNVYGEGDDGYLIRSDIVIPENGKIFIDELPLDRVYKLVETEAPAGFVMGDVNEYYFVLETQSQIRTKVQDPRKVLADYENDPVPENAPKDYEKLKELVAAMEKAKAPAVLKNYKEKDEVMEIANYQSLDLTVTKNWDDAGLESFRPDTITIDLYRIRKADYDKGSADWEKLSGKSVKLEVPKNTDVQKYTFEDLPACDDEGNAYYYKAQDEATGYKVSSVPEFVENDNGKAAIELTNKIETVDLSAVKTWVESSDFTEDFFETYRPDSIEIQLYAGTKLIDADIYKDNMSWTKKDNVWTVSIKGLPKFVDGKEAVYSITETPVEGYTPVYGDLTITNTFDKYVSKTYTKEWSDQGNIYKTRPDSITIVVTETVTGASEEYTLDSKNVTVTGSGNTWTYKIDKLPAKVKNSAGKIVDAVYTVSEKPVVGYKTEIVGDKITNTLETTDITITKNWEKDTLVKSAYRPESILVTVFADGTEFETYEIKPADKLADEWKLTVEDLPKFNSKGDEIVYTVKENAVNGYSKTESGLTIKNTLDLVSLHGTKKWVGDEDAKGNVRPASVNILLYADNREYDSSKYEVKWDYDQDNAEWTFEINDLPKYSADNVVINYTVKETDVAYGYSDSYEFGKDGDDFTAVVTNTYNTPITEFTGTKTWTGDEAYPEARPAEITVILYANGAPAADDVYFDGIVTEIQVAGSGDQWTYKFADLPELYKDGTVINYTVEEKAEPLGYAAQSYGKDLINTFTMDKIDVSGTKTWVQDNTVIRPEAITLTLLEDGVPTELEPVWVKDGDVWNYTFTDLEKYEYSKDDDGIVTRREKVYTVEETVPDMYEAEYSGYDITNTRIQQVEIVKIAADTGEILPGATLRVTKDGELIDEWVTDEEPYVITGLAAGETYTLTEVDAPDGYVNAEPVDFVVSDTGDVVRVEMTDQQTSAVFAKKDEAGNSLADALLAVYDEEGNELERWFTDGTDHEIKGLVTGKTYTLKELAAPDGYVAADDITFTAEDETSVEMIDVITKTFVSKKSNADDKYLAGAQLAVYDKDGNEIDKWVTDNTVHEIDGLKLGETYVLKELSAPDGYVVADDVEFTVSEAETNVEMLDMITVTRVYKFDAETGDPLSGASLELRDKDGKVIDSWVSDGSAHMVTGLKVGEEYTLVETSAPDGYEIADEIKFTIEGLVTEVNMLDKAVTSDKTDTDSNSNETDKTDSEDKEQQDTTPNTGAMSGSAAAAVLLAVSGMVIASKKRRER